MTISIPWDFLRSTQLHGSQHVSGVEVIYPGLSDRNKVKLSAIV